MRCSSVPLLGELTKTVPGVSQPAITPDGGTVVGVFNDQLQTQLRIVRRPLSGSWCAHADTDMPVSLPIVRFQRRTWDEEQIFGPAATTQDATVRADGKVVAWTSFHDHCDPAMILGDPATVPVMDHSELWLWFENPLDRPAWMGAFTCTAVGTGETLVRVPEPFPGNLTDESGASLSSDGQVVSFVTTADWDFINPQGSKVACAMSLDPAVAFSIRQVSEPTDQSSGAHVSAQAISGNGSVVAYALSHDLFDWKDTDHRLVNLYAPGSTATSDPNGERPPRDPIDIELLACSIQGSDVVADVNVRRFRSETARFLVTGSAASGSVVVPFAPLVQGLDIMQAAQLELRAPAPPVFTTPTCDVRVIDCTTSDCGMNSAGVAP